MGQLLCWCLTVLVLLGSVHRSFLSLSGALLPSRLSLSFAYLPPSCFLSLLIAFSSSSATRRGATCPRELMLQETRRPLRRLPLLLLRHPRPRSLLRQPLQWIAAWRRRCVGRLRTLFPSRPLPPLGRRLDSMAPTSLVPRRRTTTMWTCARPTSARRRPMSLPLLPHQLCVNPPARSLRWWRHLRLRRPPPPRCLHRAQAPTPPPRQSLCGRRLRSSALPALTRGC